MSKRNAAWVVGEAGEYSTLYYQSERRTSVWGDQS